MRLASFFSKSLLSPLVLSQSSYSSQYDRLDALEREEEANQKKMRKIAQAKAKQPIGLSTGKQKAGAASDTPNITSTQVDVSVMLEPPPRPRMWNLSADATSLQSSSSSRAFSPESPVYSTTSYEESDSTSQTLSP